MAKIGTIKRKTWSVSSFLHRHRQIVVANVFVLVLFLCVSVNVEVEHFFGHYFVRTELYLQIQDQRLANNTVFQQLMMQNFAKASNSSFSKLHNDKRRLQSLAGNTNLTKNEKLDEISRIIQRQLSDLQSIDPEECSKVKTLYCGLYDRACGFGCHVHHKMKCLMFSYVLGLPWIHDESMSWTFSDSWSKYLKPVGSNCPINDQTIFLDLVLEKEMGIDTLKHGLPLPSYLAEVITQNTDSPFIWTAGQFASAIFQVNDQTKGKIEEFKKKLGIRKQDLKGPLVGMHIRRTDKLIREAEFIPNSEFMKEAKAFRERRKLEGNLTIFVASETNEALPELRNEFGNSSWNFVGSEGQHGFSVRDRKSQLFEIVRDIQILLDCDYIICTFSSNVCRLLLELKSRGDMNQDEFIKSLDNHYRYVASNGGISPKLVAI